MIILVFDTKFCLLDVSIGHSSGAQSKADGDQQSTLTWAAILAQRWYVARAATIDRRGKNYASFLFFYIPCNTLYEYYRRDADLGQPVDWLRDWRIENSPGRYHLGLMYYV